MRMGILSVLVVASAPLQYACDSDESSCVGPEILPHESPKNLGHFLPLGNGETHDPGDPTKVPYEWTLFLRSTCSTPLVISKVCVVGDKHNGNPDDQAFTIEGPLPATVEKGQAAAVRVTYDSDEVNVDGDHNGERDPDQVAVVVQSNAKNFPTLIVPICAIIIPGADDAHPFVCESPVAVTAGQVDATLCP